MDPSLHGDVENMWRHFWARCMREVGASSRLPLEPIAPDFEQLIEEAIALRDLEEEIREREQEVARLEAIAALPPRQRLEATILEWRRPPAQAQPHQPRRRQAKALAREVGDVANDLLDRLILFPEKPDASMDRTFLAGRRHLQDCDFHLIAQLNNRLDGGGRYGPEEEAGQIYLAIEHEDHHQLVDMLWPIDFAVAAEKPDGWIFAERIATVAPRDIRGLVRLVPAKCMVAASAYIPPEGAWRADTMIIGWINRRWQCIENGLVRAHVDGRRGDTKMILVEPPPREEVHNSTAMAFSALFSHRFEWHVAFGRNKLSGPRLLIPTNPRGCLELFKSRELTNGETRRRALRHWVNEHYRQRSDDPTQLDYVCEHLRGHTRFSWAGLDCELLVSAYDLEKNAFFRRRAGEWRAARQHNRIRVRLKQ